MKKTVKIVALMLVMLMSVVMLASCSKYNAIKSDFEKAGYTLQAKDKEPTGEIKTEDGVITYTIHTFQKEAEKSDNIFGEIAGALGEELSTAVVWEFSSDKDIAEAVKNSETLKAIISDVQNSDLVNGNCVLTTVNPEAVEIFKSSK